MNSNTRRQEFRDKDSLYKQLDADLRKEICTYIQDYSVINVAIAGGTSIKPVLLNFSNNSPFFGRNMFEAKIFWVDERCVPHSSPLSNFGEAYRIWLKSDNRVKYYPMYNERDIKESIYDYTGLLAEPSNQIDIAIIGFGEDGHVASLFPPLTITSEGIIESRSPVDNTLRISLNYSTLLQSKKLYVIANSLCKRKIIDEGSVLPINFLLERHSDIKVYTV